MQKNISFVDRDNIRFNLKIELVEGRFSMSGDFGHSCGQIQDSIKPTKTQMSLIDIWNKYHLNDMHAGTPEQENALKEFKENDYKKQCEFLKSKNLYEVTLDDGTIYKYGHGWLKQELPLNLWDEITAICDKIEAEEIKRKEKFEGGAWEDLTDEKKALGKYLEITPNEAEEIQEENNNSFSYEGVYYYVGDDDMINTICEEYLKDDTGLYRSWVEDKIKNGDASSIMNIDDWARWVIESDGYGSILNHWDGGEHYDSDLKLYVIRQ